MNPKLIVPVLFAIFILQISGCKSTAVRNVENAQFAVQPNINLETIKQAIIRGSRKAGWRARELAPGVLAASYSYKRNRFGAVVKITYGRGSYDIRYHSSHNLKYNENIGSEDESPDFMSDSRDFFSENNPFSKDDNLPEATEKPATIHKIYNKWVTQLESKINAELAGLGKNNIFAESTRQLPVSVPVPVSCDDTAVFNTSGQGKISRSRVNVRNGAGTRCAKITTVNNRDTFTLLGRKNNWYYIAMSSGDNGWIYAPLVRRLDERTQVAARTSSASSASSAPMAPTPPPVPTKNISIAVIRFKTLNKEAQDISLGELVSETFTSALVNSRNFKIIEREQLDKLVKEMEMSQTGFIETTDAVEIGKMLHADAIITGSVALLGGQIQLNARIIEIESAYVISADTKTTTYTLKNINKIAKEIVAKLANRLGNR